MNSVRDMGISPNCWSFGPVAATEGLAFQIFGSYVELSEQYLVDHVKKRYNRSGVYRGGIDKRAFEFMRRFGIPYKQDYDEYTGTPNLTRALHLDTHGVPMIPPDAQMFHISAWHKVLPEYSETALEERVRIQPVTAGVNISREFIKYKAGIFLLPL